MSRPAIGRSWIVASRDTAVRHAAELDAAISAALPQSAARKVMMAITATSARATAVSTGTSGAWRLRADAASRLPVRDPPGFGGGASAGSSMGSSYSSMWSWPSPSTRRRASTWSISARSWVAITTAVPSRFISTNRRRSRRASDGSTLPVGSSAEQQLGADDQRAGDGRALLLAAGQDGRQDVHALAQAHPAQKLHDLGPVGGLVPALHPQRQRDVLVGGQVVEKAEILEDHAHAAAQPRERRRRCKPFTSFAEERDQAARGPDRQEDQAQQRRLAGAGRPGQELEGPRADGEGEVAQDSPAPARSGCRRSRNARAARRVRARSGKRRRRSPRSNLVAVPPSPAPPPRSGGRPRRRPLRRPPAFTDR